MMNSIDELYPLLRFLRIDRYNDWKMFAMDIAKVCDTRRTEPQCRELLQATVSPLNSM